MAIEADIVAKEETSKNEGESPVIGHRMRINVGYGKREACVIYKELWKNKHGVGLWMAELADVKACAPIDMSLLGSAEFVLTNEESS